MAIKELITVEQLLALDPESRSEIIDRVEEGLAKIVLGPNDGPAPFIPPDIDIRSNRSDCE